VSQWLGGEALVHFPRGRPKRGRRNGFSVLTLTAALLIGVGLGIATTLLSIVGLDNSKRVSS